MRRTDPRLLRELVKRCETLRRRLVSGGSPEMRRRLEDASYTPCAVTGTRQLDTALCIAHHQPADATRAGPASLMRARSPLRTLLPTRVVRAAQAPLRLHYDN
ncbi:DUF5133 domain-containing protein [Streptomyces sp. NBC_00704]|uniref:DUF5133 domain-containing protein n=1 Tax=Streptomyces sp. NBC_00704 TaxID=2975809 RepID=UPI002E33CB83|nr:DUF5133 domain-containing protein [Streptomyces sp. NBC_00704]